MKSSLVFLSLFSVGLSIQAAEVPTQWWTDGQEAVRQAIQQHPNTNIARNVILFIGDGMGLSTVTAARIREGQLKGMMGEENQLSFETLPYVALAKTYNTNQQTPDSAGTMSAIITGYKTKAGVISINDNVVRGDCASSLGNEVLTILEGADFLQMSTGVITTARLTHGTPAATYAHSPDRNWENDDELPEEAKDLGCRDIARQLIEFPYGNGIEVAMGGGRRNFLPKETNDPEDKGKTGRRTDDRDLTAEWLEKYANSVYVWNQAQFDAVAPATTDHLLALFERSHMEYEYDRSDDVGGEPSLSEMTTKAIEILEKNPKGFFLMVEGARIDQAHHAGNAYRALGETIELAKAVQVALDKTNSEETLIIVTADHSHVFTIAGYPTRGNPILGKVVSNDLTGSPSPADSYETDALGLPYTTLGYVNGPGYTGASDEQAEGYKSFPHSGRGYRAITAGRPDLSEVDTQVPNFMQEATVPLRAETHGGEDVAIYASGPGAHLFHGVHEQNYIAHVIIQAVIQNVSGQ